MRKRFEVVFVKYVWPHAFRDHVLRRSGNRALCEQMAERVGDARLDFYVTRATYHDKRSTVEVRDRKTGETVWEHPGVMVPSVGELGYW